VSYYIIRWPAPATTSAATCAKAPTSFTEFKKKRTKGERGRRRSRGRRNPDGSVRRKAASLNLPEGSKENAEKNIKEKSWGVKRHCRRNTRESRKSIRMAGSALKRPSRRRQVKKLREERGGLGKDSKGGVLKKNDLILEGPVLRRAKNQCGCRLEKETTENSP